MNYIELALKVWPLIEKLLALRQSRSDQGLPPLTEAEQRAELDKVAAALIGKIDDDQAKWDAAHPEEHPG